MLNHLPEKKVSKIALFYDLVFVYMISKTTEIMHHLDHGLVNPISFGLFVIIVLIFISSWMVQTVFTNRYGHSSWLDIAFYFVDMMIVLFMSNSFDTNNLTEMRVLFISAGCLSTTLALHYLITYFQVKTEIDKKITKTYFGFLIFRALCLVIGGILDNLVGFVIAIIGLGLSWLMPLLMNDITRQHPIIFPHFLERLNLLVIVIFGETIIGIADYFRPHTLSVYSVLLFIMVALLFLTYVLQFDWIVQEDQPDATSSLLIYLHYFIIFGISLITVSLKFIHEQEALSWFAVSCLFGGILLFYFGLALSTRYNKKEFKLSKLTIGIFSVSTLLGFALCLIVPDFPVIVITSFVVVLINTLHLIHVALTPHEKIHV